MRDRSKKIIILTGIISAITVGTILTFAIYAIYFAPATEYTLELKVGQYNNEPKYMRMRKEISLVFGPKS